jgi:uncharacterized protein
MSDHEDVPRLARLAIHPIKSLDPVVRESGRIAAGALDGDRAFAIRDAEGEYVNGKRTNDVHRLRATFDAAIDRVSLRVESDGAERTETDGRQTFSLAGDRTVLETVLTEYFGYPVTVDRDSQGGFPDDTIASGPTVVSTATLGELASWFPGLSVSSMRQRLRANVEIEGVPPFWEDRLFAGPEETVPFRIGDVAFEGVSPCQRCVVPSRDPRTGTEYEGFRETFMRNRERTLPAWSNEERFDHFFRAMVNTRVPQASWGESIAVGDRVHIEGEPA